MNSTIGNYLKNSGVIKPFNTLTMNYHFSNINKVTGEITITTRNGKQELLEQLQIARIHPMLIDCAHIILHAKVEIYLKQNHTELDLSNFLHQLDFNYPVYNYDTYSIYGNIWLLNNTELKRISTDNHEFWYQRPVLTEIPPYLK